MAKGYADLTDALCGRAFEPCPDRLHHATGLQRQCAEVYTKLLACVSPPAPQSSHHNTTWEPCPIKGWGYDTYRKEAEAILECLNSWIHDGVDPQNIIVHIFEPELLPWLEAIGNASSCPLQWAKPWSETLEGSWSQRLVSCLFHPSVPSLFALLKHPLSGHPQETVPFEDIERALWRGKELSVKDPWVLLSSSFRHDAPQWGEKIHALRTAHYRLKSIRTPDQAHAMLRDLLEVWRSEHDTLLFNTAPVHADIPFTAKTYHAWLLHTLETPISIGAGIKVVHAPHGFLSSKATHHLVAGCHQGGWPLTEQRGLRGLISLNLAKTMPEGTVAVRRGDPRAWLPPSSTIFCTWSKEGSATPASWWLRHPPEPWTPPSSLLETKSLGTTSSFHPQRPQPCPPLALRPRRISITDLDLCQKDAYAFYAKTILGIRETPSLHGQPWRQRQGQMIHRFLEQCTQHHDQDSLPPLPSAHDIDDEWLWAEPQHQQWIRAWQQSHPDTHAMTPEVTGSWTMTGPEGDLIIHGRADCVTVTPDGHLNIIDYKTGTPPTQKDIQEGRALQLTLLALMARQGALIMPHNHSSQRVVSIAYQVFRPHKDIKSITEDVSNGALLDKIEQHINTWVEQYDNPQQGYRAEVKRADPYQFLKRVEEWRNHA